MINLDQLFTGMTLGTIALVLGLVPGLLEQFADGISDIANSVFLVRFPRRASQQFQERYWFALLGTAMIALTLLAYVSN